MNPLIPAGAGCLHCIDGFTADGVDPFLGPVFIPCPWCLFNGAVAVCGRCFGECWFPTDYLDPLELALHLYRHGRRPKYCLDCGGVTRVMSLSTAPEVDQ
jgi:hypothetical protein